MVRLFFHFFVCSGSDFFVRHSIDSKLEALNSTLGSHVYWIVTDSLFFVPYFFFLILTYLLKILSKDLWRKPNDFLLVFRKRKEVRSCTKNSNWERRQQVLWFACLSNNFEACYFFVCGNFSNTKRWQNK